MEKLNTIKGTAMNRDRARVWVESPKLAAYGFTRGASIAVEFGRKAMYVTITDDGDRKVSGRSRGGKDLSIIDVCFSDDVRRDMFGGAARLDVWVEQDQIVIKAAEAK